ncbi:unnamed protein product [Ascophyllum nodosum]
MSRRMSSPKASISELGCSGVNKTLTEAVRTSKRRRKDSTPSTALRCRSTSASKHQSTSAAVAVNQSKHVMGHAAEGKGSGASPGSSSSVVMVHVPSNFSFSQAACSYGYYLVPPNRWEPSKDVNDRDGGTFFRPLRFGERLANTAKCSISQVAVPAAEEGGEKTAALRVDVAAQLTDPDMEDIVQQVTRMFQTTMDLQPWFRLSAEAEQRGYGRLFRSPTIFEDMVKSITGCNMKFQGTIRMNKLLCEKFGRNGAFPTPHDLEGVQAEDLKDNAKVGYRADRILRLAKSFRDGTVDPKWLGAGERTRDEVFKFVKNLYGFGDYAAGNVTMLLGFYEEVPLDSETVRHFKDFYGVTTKNVKEVAPKARQQYAPYAPYQFLQYWYEMIVWHERKRGKEVHLWDASDFSW